jgi:hypothetical protein
MAGVGLLIELGPTPALWRSAPSTWQYTATAGMDQRAYPLVARRPPQRWPRRFDSSVGAGRRLQEHPDAPFAARAAHAVRHGTRERRQRPVSGMGLRHAHALSYGARSRPVVQKMRHAARPPPPESLRRRSSAQDALRARSGAQLGSTHADRGQRLPAPWAVAATRRPHARACRSAAGQSTN